MFKFEKNELHEENIKKNNKKYQTVILEVLNKNKVSIPKEIEFENLNLQVVGIIIYTNGLH
jgi:hypothetical protein